MDITNPEHFIDHLQEKGFTLELSEPFHSTDWGHDEMFYVLFHKELKTLVWFDTYEGDRVNATHWHCCWKPLDHSQGVPVRCSSRYDTDHYILTGTWKSWSMTMLELLKDSGTLVSGWKENQFSFNLRHYQDDADLRKVRSDLLADWAIEFRQPHLDRLKRLPSHVWETLK